MLVVVPLMLISPSILSPAQSRSESRASKTSISTIDDVNLAFDETIALAEEVLGKSSEGISVECARGANHVRITTWVWDRFQSTVLLQPTDTYTARNQFRLVL